MPDLETLMTDLTFPEQPRWREGRLWFSDWGTREVIAVDAEGHSEVILQGPSFPLCVDWLPDGRLLAAMCTSTGVALTSWRARSSPPG